MTKAVSIEQVGDIGFFRPVQSCRFQQAVQLVAIAMVQAREQGLRKLLVNSHGLTGFDPPSVFERLAMIRTWAESAQGRLKVAMVTPPELMDSERIGVVIAASVGLDGNTFASEAEALDWLNQGD
jgi:hypothetical protein